jgi:hypothetical protein
VIEYVFVQPATHPAPLFMLQGNLAAWVSGPQHDALGNPPSAGIIERDMCRRYTLIGPCPNGYHGLWGQDGHQ